METKNKKSDFATYTNPHPGILLEEELGARNIAYEDFASAIEKTNEERIDDSMYKSKAVKKKTAIGFNSDSV